MKSETGAYAAALDLNIIKKIDKILPRTYGSFKFWTQEKAEVAINIFNITFLKLFFCI
tara:strand:- start:1476 stop:1649 length:174 start_codon:yes stop_codon:yes gene_type:complete